MLHLLRALRLAHEALPVRGAQPRRRLLPCQSRRAINGGQALARRGRGRGSGRRPQQLLLLLLLLRGRLPQELLWPEELGLLLLFPSL